jgi:uncharacterized protein YbaP (TraB family)
MHHPHRSRSRSRTPRLTAALSLSVAFLFALLLASGCSGEKHTTDVPQAPIASAGAAPSASSSAEPVASATSDGDAGAQTAPTPAASVWKPLLYRVTIAGAKPSYLFGTIHIPDPRIALFPASLDKAIAAADEIVNEMPLDDASQAHMAGAVKMPAGKKLSTSIPPALYARLKQVFASKGLPDAVMIAMDGFKVWAVAVQVTMLDHMREMMTGGKAIDMVLHDRGVAGHKRTTGLETEAEQLAVFDGLTNDEQARMLEQVLDERDKDLKEGKDPIAVLMSLYIAGEEAPLLAELNGGFDLKRPLDQKLMKRLITDRNKIMAQRTDARIKAHPTQSYFIAVGAAHLLGDDGVIAQLKKKGYAVERVQQ